jgi:hypothetical protein
MGRMLIEAVMGAGDCRLAGALDQAASPMLGQDAGSARMLPLSSARPAASRSPAICTKACKAPTC